MEFPDEIVRLIRDYSRPLKRRTLSDFWLWENIVIFDDMLSYLCEHVYQQFYESYGPFELIKTENYVIKSIVNKKFNISFHKEDLMCWSGQYNYNGYVHWVLEEDIYHKQLLNDKKVVYSKCYLNGIHGLTFRI